VKITNRFNLPESIYNVISKVRKPSENKISVTELIDSPLIRHLRIEHWDSLEEDASDRLWALLGTAIHYAIEKGTPQDALAEERLEVKVDDITLSGQADLYQAGEVSDWKTSSVYAFLLGMKDSWSTQLQSYAFLYRSIGFPVSSLKVHAILRDWMKSKAMTEPDYPQIPFITVDVPVWSEEKVKQYIDERIKLHFHTPPEKCSDEERWMRPTTYAVMKGSNKRASRVLDTMDKAEAWIGDQKGFSIVERPGKDVRCEDHCQVRAFCPYRRD
jgi:hypothetical protein